MKFSIITPSFRASRWLKLNIASVADQNVDCEHIVQDSCSDDGTPEWLAQDTRVRAYIEKDAGMYDAINRGLRRASGDILAYLNADEQYLPGTLASVHDYFKAHPHVDVLFGDAIIVDSLGDYLAHRMASLPTKLHTLVGRSLAILTCSTFFRRSIIDQRNLFFDPRLTNVGDAEWIVRLLDEGVCMSRHPAFTSAYTFTGQNMSLSAEARQERSFLVSAAPSWARHMSWLVTAHHRWRRFLAGHYRPLAPFQYEVYTSKSPGKRATKRADTPTFHWPS